MGKDPLMKIKNLKQMSRQIGKDIARSMSIPINELTTFIKPKEIRSIIKQYCVEQDGDYLINTMILNKVFHEVNNWVLGIKLCRMASSGDLATAWDEEQNCMIFYDPHSMKEE